MKIPYAALLLTTALLGGCAATVQKGASTAPLAISPEASQRVVLHMTGSAEVLQSKDWEAFKGEWRGALRGEAASAGIAFDALDSLPPPGGRAPGTLLVVHVNDYRYLTPGARCGLGILTGNAYIDARLRFLDLKSGASFGEQSVNTSSTAWQGIFSAMTDKQVAAISRDVVQQLKAR